MKFLPDQDFGGLAGDFPESGGDLVVGVFPLDADRSLIAALPQDAEKRAEIIAADTGHGAACLFRDLDVGDDVQRGLEVGRGVAAAGHVIEIGKHADVRLAGGADEFRALGDVVDEIALFRAELLDGDGDAVGWRRAGRGL